jgi:purine-cytosine permease-like protein
LEEYLFVDPFDCYNAIFFERNGEMRWIASIIWALIASFTTSGLIAFVLGGLDHAWVIVLISLIWLAVFLRACPRIYDISGYPTPPS